MISFLKGFWYAFRGVAESICAERNMRVHIVISLYVLYFSQFYELSVARFALVIAVIAFVLALELMNTAVERVCDAVTTEKNPLIKMAKDAAAGAVLIGAVASVVIGVLIFWDTRILWEIISSLCYSPEGLTIFILTLLASSVFVVVGPKELVDSIKTMGELEKEFEKADKKEDKKIETENN